MGRPSAIEKRRLAGEELVKKFYGQNFVEYQKLPPSRKFHHLVKGLVGQSAREAGLAISKEDLDSFVAELQDQAAFAAEKARRDYIFTLTRRTQLPKYGAAAFNAWKVKQLREADKAKVEASDELEDLTGLLTKPSDNDG